MTVLTDTDTVTVNAIDLRSVLAAAVLVPDFLKGKITTNDVIVLLSDGFQLTPDKLTLACLKLTDALDPNSDYAEENAALVEEYEGRVKDFNEIMESFKNDLR